MRSHSVAWGLLGMVLTCPGLAQQNAPATGLYRFSIPAEPLGDALSDLAKQAGLQVMISSKLVEGVQSRELKGAFSANEALRQLLANTGLQFTFVNPRTVAINAAASAPPKSGQPTSETPSPSGVEDPKAQPDSKLNSTDGGKKMQNRGFLARLLGLFALCGSATHTGTTCAQETGSTGSGALEEVVVTAQKREERLLDVPMSVSALSGEQLMEANISSTGDLQQLSPGLVTVNNGLAFTPAIRGISSVGTSPGDETNVSLYLDDVYLGAPLAGLFDLKDIQRVEVLRGPQGTLFGRNATGGAVRIVTLAPSFTPSAEVSADYGFDFDEIKLGAYATGPLSEHIAGSLNVTYRHEDGYVDGVGPLAGKTFGDVDNYGVRGKLRFDLSSDLSVTVAADYSHRDDPSVFLLIPHDGQNANRSTPGVVMPGPLEYSALTKPIIQVTSKGAGVDAQWNVSPALAIHSITAYREADGLYQTDTDRANLSIGALRLQQDQKTFSQELNFSGPDDRAFDWLAGLYFYSSDAGNPYFRSYGGGDAPNGPIVASFSSNVDTTSYAVFGELGYDVTSRLHLIAGTRFTSEKKEFKYRDIVRAAGLRVADEDETWNSWTYRGVARYSLTDDFNIYASVSTGFKSGVYNAYAYPATPPVDPEKLTAYEIGTRGRVGPITLTAAIFDYDYKNIQVQGQTFISGGAWVVTLNNAAKASIRGFELTASGNLLDSLAYEIGYSGLPTAKYKNFESAQVFIPNATGGATNTVPYDASGSRVIRAPKSQWNARLTYAQQLLGSEFRASANYAYNSGFYWQPGNFSHEGSYGLLNARLSWTDSSGRYTYSVWGENLTDEIYSMYTQSGTVGISEAIAQPRQVGVGIAAKF